MRLLDRESEGILKCVDYINSFYQLNSIDDSELFNKLDNMTKQEKEELEEAFVGLAAMKKKNDNGTIVKKLKAFFDKYENYVIEKANKNVMEYINNNYLNYLYCKELEKNSKNSDYNGQINNKSLFDIYNAVWDKYEEIFAKLDNNDKITKEEREFVKKCILIESGFVLMDNNREEGNYLINDIVEYVDKYPIKEFDNIENRQLYVLYNLSKYIIKMGANVFVQANKGSSVEDFLTLGKYITTKSGRNIIVINDIDDLWSEEKMYECLFTVFHELGHLHQKIEPDQYKDFQEWFDMEWYIIKNNRYFYDRYHDSFLLEKTADNFAQNIMLEMYKDEKKEIIMDVINKHKEKKRIETPKFSLMIYQRYHELLESKEKKISKK